MNTNPSTFTPVALPRDIALALLERSMDFGHGAVAVARLAVAVKCGAAVSDRHWRFCQEVVSHRHDPELAQLLNAARRLGAPSVQIA